MTNFKLNLKWKRITAILLGMGVLSTLTFNCAPSMFQSRRDAMSDLSSHGGPDVFDGPKRTPIVLMTARQTYKTFMNVTGQEGAQTNAQLTEYEARYSSLSVNDRLTNIGAPMQMAATSLAGEVCNGLLTREVAAAAAARKFFGQVNFGASVAQNNKAAFDSAVSVMANSFWNRQPTDEETAALNAFYSEFSAVAGNAAAGTRNLYLAACTGMLASFDSYTY